MSLDYGLRTMTAITIFVVELNLKEASLATLKRLWIQIVEENIHDYLPHCTNFTTFLYQFLAL